MDKGTTNEPPGQISETKQSLDELAREGARRMIVAALELGMDQYLDKPRYMRDENGHALVVPNGKAGPRTVSLGASTIQFQAPRVDDRPLEQRLASKILPLCRPEMNIRSKIN